MSLFTALTDLLIKPLELLFETIFTLAYKIYPNPGTAIIFLSLFMNLLVLPLYKRADAMQEQTMEEEKKLQPWVEHIKANFSGDERYMILQAYYRQNHYKPTNALRGSVSLLLEVPFFMAAYRFLSELLLVKECSFGPITDLGAPDGIFVIAGITINVLPILMTVINLISGYIYTKGFPLKSKLQLYGMALLFLFLLYESPAALVLYWTLNNVFSLVKNVISRSKTAKIISAAVLSLLGLYFMADVLLFHPMVSAIRQIMVISILFLFQLPAIHMVRHKLGRKSVKHIEVVYADKKLFFSCGLLLTAVTGLLIPSAIVSNSPQEFVNGATLLNPVVYLFSAFLTAAGTFLVWGSVFYLLSGPGAKRIMSLGMAILSSAAIVNYMFFGRSYGNLSPNLIFDVLPVPARTEKILNLAVLCILAVIVSFIFAKRKKFLTGFCITASAAFLIMSFIHLPAIYNQGAESVQAYKAARDYKPSIPLSRHGKNVMILMMDRAVGLNVPFIFEERPELKEQFRGFTYYPNTLSHGMNTNLGSPGIFGGYEYTPDQMNRKLDQTLEEKHDEALLVLPRLFQENGYEITVVDPPLAGYSVIPAASVYERYPDMHAYWLMDRYFTMSLNEALSWERKITRNLFYYSLFKISPVMIQPILYAEGSYNDIDELEADHLNVDIVETYGQVTDGPSKSKGFNPSFMASYRVLEALPEFTDLKDTDQNTFLALANNLPHSPMLLQLPEYEPAMVVDNTSYDREHGQRFDFRGYQMDVSTGEKMANHHCNMATMLLLGKWFDFLKENGVYDNTRIIVVSDHGYAAEHFEDLLFIESWPHDVLAFNALMMVKDFDDHKDFSMDTSFMTNADVPALVTQGLVDNPRNPFTGKSLQSSIKDNPEQIISGSSEWKIFENNTAQYLPCDWYRVSKDFYKPESWKQTAKNSVLPDN